MASSYGEDAAPSALQAAYTAVAVTTRLAPAHRARINADVLSHLQDFRAWREAPLVLGYMPNREEFDSLPILRSALALGKDVALPVLGDESSTLSFRVVRSLEGLVRGRSGGLEPAFRTSRALPSGLGLSASVCLVPGLVFDAAGYRIGYGAGYWDNFLRHYDGTKIGLASGMQVGGNPLPHAECDVPVDYLVTEDMVWRCRR